MLATRAVASSCFLTKSRIGPRPPRVAHPATAARSRYTPSHQAHAVQSRNKQQLNTQRETATVIIAAVRDDPRSTSVVARDAYKQNSAPSLLSTAPSERS